jgi:hypothetical protein
MELLIAERPDIRSVWSEAVRRRLPLVKISRGRKYGSVVVDWWNTDDEEGNPLPVATQEIVDMIRDCLLFAQGREWDTGKGGHPKAVAITSKVLQYADFIPLERIEYLVDNIQEIVETHTK